ncbi:MAG: thioredoxin domain-containing protein [Gemmatimonadaceae bacterium]|nr:thioredoxin domain-containing protein [Gemmatimonadaceae bacterium]
MAHVLLHFPVSGHRFAPLAARAAECAGEHQRFSEFIERVFEKQDSLGLKPWSEFASESGIRDTAVFAQCMRSKDPLPALDRGARIGRALGVQGTPTVIINGWQFRGVPPDTLFERIVRDLLAGRAPF